MVNVPKLSHFFAVFLGKNCDNLRSWTVYWILNQKLFDLRSTLNFIDKCHLVAIYGHKGQFTKSIFPQKLRSPKNSP